LNKIGELVHWGLYAAAFLILVLGGLIAYNRNLFAVAAGTGTVAGRAGALGALHQMAWALALMLIFVHAVAALYHQFILRDRLLNRMWISG
jgi:cytochrome b561